MKPPRESTNSPAQDAWWSSQGIVYFFGAGDPTVAIKIGVAALTKGCGIKEGMTRRLREIQTSNHETVYLLGIIRFTEGRYPTRDAEILERELHIRFAEFQRFKPHTRGAEWFSASDEILDYIRLSCMSPELLSLPRTLATPIKRQDAAAGDPSA